MRDNADVAGLSVFLTTLARADAARIKAAAEALLPLLEPVEVVQSRSGLVMLPMRDTVKGCDFFLGEVLVAEARIFCTGNGIEGYGMVTGRDLAHAMAMALLDAARAAGLPGAAEFAAEEMARHEAEDRALLCRIEATRVEMETF